jgi:hypothetical protein
MLMLAQTQPQPWVSGANNTGTVTNAAAITANSTSSDDARSYGIFVRNGIGDLNNTGDILAEARSGASGPSGANTFGIYSYEMLGNIYNSGDIVAYSNSGGNPVESYGLRADILSGSVNNTGNITAIGRVEGDGKSYGIFVQSDDIAPLGTVDNSGQVTADTYVLGNAEAYGIYVVNTGSVTNTGGVNATARSGVDKSAEAWGIDGNFVEGNVTNTGTILANAIADHYNDHADASAFGISIGIINGSIVNSGDITALANAETVSDEDAEAYANGIKVNEEMVGDIVNTGSIWVNATSNATGDGPSAEAEAYGIHGETLFSYSSMAGGIWNEGSIDALATATADGENSDAYAKATGIGVPYYMTGSVENSGSIRAKAFAEATGNSTSTPEAEAEASGISLGYEMEGDITNSVGGTILAEAWADAYGSEADADAYAYGIYLYDGTFFGNISNNGTIEAYADAQTNASDSDYSYALAYGVSIYGTEGDMLNDGTIRAEAYSNAEGYASADAKGIYFDSIEGDVLNSQTIEALADASASGEESIAYAYAHGISVYSMTGNILNTGSITAQAQAFASDTNYAYAYGISAIGGPLSIYGDIFNSGTIQATALSDGEGDLWVNAYGIYANGAGTVQNDETGLISVVSDDFGFGMYVKDGNTYLNNYGTIIVDAFFGAGLAVGSGDWDCRQSRLHLHRHWQLRADAVRRTW